MLRSLRRGCNPASRGSSISAVKDRRPSAEGDGLQIELHYRDVRPDMPTSAAARAALPEVTATPAEWIVSNRGKPFEALPEGPGVWGPRGGWVFAGSRFVKRRDPETGVAREVYDADGAGQIIGLTTFGSETIAWRQILSPESSITAPLWLARRERVPIAGTPVVVRIGPE